MRKRELKLNISDENFTKSAQTLVFPPNHRWCASNFEYFSRVIQDKL